MKITHSCYVYVMSMNLDLQNEKKTEKETRKWLHSDNDNDDLHVFIGCSRNIQTHTQLICEFREPKREWDWKEKNWNWFEIHSIPTTTEPNE